MVLKTRGFTLIEMLIVITIIGILASILFPVFSAVQKKGASHSLCLSAPADRARYLNVRAGLR